MTHSVARAPARCLQRFASLVSALLLLFLAAAPVVANAAASFRVVQQWTAADGLPAETVAGLAIDREAQLWLATYDGVVRYQGYDFRHYNRDSKPALPGNRLMAIHAAPANGVIVHFEDGRLGHLTEQAYTPIDRAEAGQVVVFDQQLWFIQAGTGALLSWSARDGLTPRTARLLSALAVDDFAGQLLLGTRTGTVLTGFGNAGRVKELPHFGDEPVLGLAAGPNGELLALDRLGARLYAPSSAGWTASLATRWERPQQRALRATWTGQGWLLANLVTASGAGPHRLDRSGLRALVVPEATGVDADRSPGRIYRMDARGQRWINDGQRLWRDGQLMFGSDERIHDFVVDPFDQVWVAQPMRGLRLLKQSVIDTLGHEPGELPDPNIYLVTELDGDILVGSWVALSRLDPATGQWTQLLRRAARDVLPDGDGLLVGSQGLCRLQAPGQCARVDGFPGGEAEVLMLHRDGGGAVWAGTDSGLYRRAPDGHWQARTVDPARVRTALEDPAGRLLFGTDGDGLLVLPDRAEPELPLTRIGPSQGLASAFVRALLAVPGGATLVGTEDAGLCLVNQRLEVVRCLSTSGGLPHHSVHYMLVDAHDRMWVNTNAGIYRVDLPSLLAFLQGERDSVPAFSRFDDREGLLSVEGNGGVYHAGAMTADGRIWFPNQLGLVVIRPERDIQRPDVPLAARIRITGATDEELPRRVRHARQLDLELTAIALAEPQNVQFRYRLASDSAWQPLGTRRQLNFRNLAPGRQRLEVQASYPHSDWIGPPARLEFTVDYRFHEHPAFRGLAIALAALILLAAWQIARRRRQALELSVRERSVQLAHATEQLTRLTGSLRRVDLRHRTAMHAVSRELKAALNAVMAPVLKQTGKPVTAPQARELRSQARTLNALIEQLDSLDETDSMDPDIDQRDALDVGANQAAMPARSDKNRPAPGNSADLMARIHMEVLLHLGDADFSVDDLARRLGMSRSALYRQVAGSHGTSPAELIRELRLEQAIRLLSESDQQVSTIAYATGFRSVSAFSRAFSKKMGTSPRHWRDRYSESSGQSDGKRIKAPSARRSP